MKVLFLSLIDFNSIDERGIYTDLLREFIKNCHEVYAISPVEKRKSEKTYIINEKDYKILKIKIGNIQKTNFIEKGISIILVEHEFIQGIKKYFGNTSFDLVLYATPPVTFQKVVEFVKRRDGAMSYLLLKDIWPQGVLDMQALTTVGLKGLIYRFFKAKEEKLYSISDHIGCMSPKNREYLLQHNPGLPVEKVEVCPNSIDPMPKKFFRRTGLMRKKLDIPDDSIVFLYGGNLGKPQGIDFIMQVIERFHEVNNAYLLIVGSGTEYKRLENYIHIQRPERVMLLQHMPKDEYDALMADCDVGLIFLDRRFTIPNFPSRMTAYMEASMAMLAATDINTDVRELLETNDIGLWCESLDATDFLFKAKMLCDIELIKCMGERARRYLEENYMAKDSYQIIIKQVVKRG